MTFNWTFTNFTAANVLHFGTIGGTESELATIIRSHLTDAMFKVIANDGHITSFDIIKLDGSSATVHQVDGSPQGGGTVSAQPIPNTGPVVSLKTGLRGRSHRGRVYLPGVAESVFSGGLISQGDADDIGDGWFAFIGACASDDVTLVVASYALATATAVETLSVDARCATQRRRQTRVAA